MRLDTTAIAAGLLHDAVEDTSVTIDEIKTEFGEQVAHIVEGVTKISKIDFASSEEAQAENVRKMVLAMMDDIRVVLIKLADRLHNMRTLKFLSPERQQKIARETLDIYAPIAHRLGMGKIRGELEDLAFQYVDPISYNQVKDAIESRRKEGEAFLAEVQGVIEQKLKENKIQARVEARIKRLYSIWQKLQRQRISVDQIYDMLALRIITQSESRLLRRAGHHSQPMAAGAGAHQRLHRHPAQQFLQVAAHHGHLREGPCLRGADPHRRDAQDGRGRHRGALEVQRRPGLGAR